MTRRQMFADSLMTALGISAAAPETTSETTPRTNATLLEWLIDKHGPDVVSRELAGMIDVQDLRRRLRGAAQRERRHAETRRRREQTSDVVVFRGPVNWGCLDPTTHREVRNRGRRRVAVMSSRVDMTLGSDLIPAGSRILIDMRHGFPAYPMCELIETRDGSRRVHLWGFKGEFDPARGRSFATPHNHRPDEDVLYDVQEEMEASSR